jgi:hypothetical protein
MILRRAVLGGGLLLPFLGRVARGLGTPLVFLGDRALPPYEFLEGGVARGANSPCHATIS